MHDGYVSVYKGTYFMKTCFIRRVKSYIFNITYFNLYHYIFFNVVKYLYYNTRLTFVVYNYSSEVKNGEKYSMNHVRSQQTFLRLSIKIYQQDIIIYIIIIIRIM